MSGWRNTPGVTLDRSKPISFRWAGRSYQGYAGDTLASALLANGVSIIGRSFKYHRPRGLIAAGLEEPNGIVQLEQGATTVPNVKATQLELYEGLSAAPINARPSAEFDLLAINSLFKRFIPAAFYYKTFFWPNWGLFEPTIRKAAGLGVAPAEPDPDRYEHRFAHVDTLVIGSGAAGLAAAEAAAALPGNQRVMLVEADFEFGGGLLSCVEPVEGLPPLAWRDAALARLRAAPNLQLLNRTMAFGFYDHGLVALCERINDHLPPMQRSGPRQRLWKVRCRKVILATGAFERPIPFSGNDLPGVMLASAAQTYAARYGVLAGRRLVLCTNNGSAYTAALALHDAGCEIAAIVDSRSEPGASASEARRRGIAILHSAVPVAAKGRKAVRGLEVAALNGGGRQQLACDTILTSDGWNPAVHLHSQSGGSLAYDARLQAFLPNHAAQEAISVGAAAGLFDLATVLANTRATVRGETVATAPTEAVGPTRRFADGDTHAQTAWLDFQNDVTVADVQLAARENFRSVEHLKRYTTLGMASDQGKTSNVAGIHVMSDLLKMPPQAISTTKFRPPFDPVTIGAFAGRAVGEDLSPLAHTPAHAAQLALGAKMENYGAWRRAAFLPLGGESEAQSIAREVTAVRDSVGLFDASTLGKIEVKGPDAAEFLQRMYVNSVRTLKVGRCRYGLMLSEHGIVYDDGVFARIGEDHFLVGTTSGHAAAITETFQEWLQCEWPHLRVLVENVTTGWAVMNLAGPHARDVLAALGTDIDLSPDAFPHMHYRAGTVAGVAARVQRVSFTGELSYEIAVPWGYGASLWDAAMLAGRPHRITAFGVEALMVMRMEKGFLHIGSDSDGETYPQDLGFAAIIAKKKDDFVGRRSTMRAHALREERRQLVGLEVADGGGPLQVGAHVLPADATEARGTQGWVTSSAQSPTLQRPIAMALVQRGRARMGETVRIWDLDTWRPARIADPQFFDPSGVRIHG
ncbi:sarcosine oxidase subunit alpha [Burkholderia lata]|uniref:Sarcosine oxidase subunit alpha n=1 Tax=Burkholderia lata (strain ATCC 17760 / DSM 23089 / LMG 22485 / NCIMB 9086 / R18194 / 383) TaxID=482957 RepID=A0A6P2SS59_BURL3|nr:sarcosine oxidase subunit alpha family protein [Burkholderia lata]VWC51074.1 sarcosine oxidase subunit alpha [Burkholderia lata]